MKRFRELRKDQATRDKYADVSLSAADFIYPYFVVEGENQKEEISTMPGIYRFSIDTLLKDIEEIKNLGINKVLLFGVIPDEQKDERGSAAYADNVLFFTAGYRAPCSARPESASRRFLHQSSGSVPSARLSVQPSRQ